MTDLEDLAEAGGSGGPEIHLTSDLPQRPRSKIASADLVDHDDLTAEGMFPEHGSFLEMENDQGTEYWECTATLAKVVVEAADEEGIETENVLLDVTEVMKTPSGEWRFVVDVAEAS